MMPRAIFETFETHVLLKIEYHANATFKNPLQNSEKIASPGQRLNVSNNGKQIIPYHASFFFKVPSLLCFKLKIATKTFFN